MPPRLFLLPAGLSVIVLRLWPAALALHQSLLAPRATAYSLDNYVYIFTDPVFLNSVWITLLYSADRQPAADRYLARPCAAAQQQAADDWLLAFAHLPAGRHSAVGVRSGLGRGFSARRPAQFSAGGARRRAAAVHHLAQPVARLDHPRRELDRRRLLDDDAHRRPARHSEVALRGRHHRWRERLAAFPLCDTAAIAPPADLRAGRRHGRQLSRLRAGAAF